MLFFLTKSGIISMFYHLFLILLNGESRMKFIVIIFLYFSMMINLNSQPIELIDSNQVYNLNGEWKFIESNHLDFALPDINDSVFRNISLPGLWRRQNLDSVHVGWYRKQIFISENWRDKKISLLTPSITDANQLFFNGVKISEEGEIDASGKCLVNDSRANVVHIPDSLIKINSMNTIAIRVCNFAGFAGSSGNFLIGPKKKIKEGFYRTMVWNAAIGLIFLFVALYHLILFLGSKKDLSYFYFSVACYLAFSLTIGYYRFTYWVYSSYWSHFYFFNSGFGLMPMFLVFFIHSFFEYRTALWVRILNYFVFFTFILFLFSGLSIDVFKIYAEYGQPFMILVGIPYAFSVSSLILKAIHENKDRAKIIGIGLLILLFAFVNSLLIYFNIINTINLLPEAFLIFVFSIAVALAAKFYTVNEQILIMQRNHSEELERKIKERTKDLEDAKKTAEIETGIAWIAQRESQEEKEKTEKLLKEIQKDMRTAQKIQQNILPNNLDRIRKLKFATLYKPVTNVGGDFYDIEEIKPGLIRAFIADATGHGVQAALITMAIKSEYESVKDLLNSPAKILKFLNENFSNKYKSLHIYFTAFIIDIDTIYDRVTYSSAGHTPQILINNNKLEILTHRGNIIGMIPDVEYDEEEKEFNSGRIYLFTDGISEEFNELQEQFGDEKVIETLDKNKDEPLQKSVDALYSEVLKFVGKAKIKDDITLIGIEYND